VRRHISSLKLHSLIIYCNSQHQGKCGVAGHIYETAHIISLGLRAVPVQYGLDGPVVRARTRAVKHLVNQLDGR